MIRGAIALLAALCLGACQARETWPAPSPALWEVTAAGGQHGYLFGTIHALPDGAAWRTARLADALANSSTLVVEVADLSDDAAGSRAFDAVAHHAGLPPLLARVPPGERPALAAALQRAGFDEGDFAATETWAAALMIANAQQQGSAGNGVDRALLAHKRPVVALEGFAEQFGLFDTLPLREQADLLVLASEESAPRQDRAMTKAWLTGDLAALQREAETGILADPELRDVLLVRRNRVWTGTIAALLAEGRRPFVAVGAAHMLGREGLPAQLAARGFAVRRIQ